VQKLGVNGMLEVLMIAMVILFAYKFGTAKEIYVRFEKDKDEKKPPTKRLKK
jgi:hypothetical protein